jgi:hypothetical protein
MTDVSTWDTFDVADVIGKIADDRGINVVVDGVDDTCFGLVVTSDKSFVDFLAQHKDTYNFQIIDGDPIRVVRRAVNDDLVIDKTIAQADCKITNGAAFSAKRTDIASLPRQTEIQYIDPDRDFATTTQAARHPGMPTSNVASSVQIDFVLTGAQARGLAFDQEYRLLAQQLSASFEHEDIDIEPGDTINITGDLANFTLLAQETTYTASRTNLITANVILVSSVLAPGGIVFNAGDVTAGIAASDGTPIVPGVSDQYVTPNTAADNADWLLTVI